MIKYSVDRLEIRDRSMIIIAFNYKIIIIIVAIAFIPQY